MTKITGSLLDNARQFTMHANLLPSRNVIHVAIRTEGEDYLKSFRVKGLSEAVIVPYDSYPILFGFFSMDSLLSHITVISCIQ